jgi:heme-degrading monooxygenase HmoA
VHAPRGEYPRKLEDVGTAPELIPLVTGSDVYSQSALPSFSMRASMDAIRGNAIVALGAIGTDKALDPRVSHSPIRHHKSSRIVPERWAKSEERKLQRHWKTREGAKRAENCRCGVSTEIRGLGRGDTSMIARIWHGWTDPADADAYEALLKEEIFVGIADRKIPGYEGIRLLRRSLDKEVEFVTIMTFQDLDAVRQFAGDDYEVAVVPDKARALLARFDQRSQHYEVRVDAPA